MKTITRLVKPPPKIDPTELSLNERLVAVDRVAKVVKGGKRLAFRALVVVGDGQGHVGSGVDKAREVPEAIRKAGVAARKSLIKVPITDGTIPHEVFAKYKAAKILIRPAAPGTGIRAAGGVRAVIESAGIKDILTKSLGSSNQINLVRATILALASLRQPEEALALRKGSESVPPPAETA
ncbi:MAG: 30S ribosomal protein S5 [Dehalococcoidia bacterium]|nr:30S ribosomal protein S5 [Dehalococcoidia bacterium]